MKHPIQPLICAAVVLTASCATYQPAPLDPHEVLAGLQSLSWGPPERRSDPSAAPPSGPRELSAFAITTNPALATLRAELGIRRALLVEAGLLPDPEFGWDAMDLLASEIVDGGHGSIDVLSGLGVMFPILAPGERSSRIGAAQWRREEARRLLIVAEWRLTRDVHVAFEEVIGAEALLHETEALIRVASSTREYFERARSAGAATAIQANLALGELQAIQLRRVAAEARVERARRSLNLLLGLPPGYEVSLELPIEENDVSVDTNDLEHLIEGALHARPDLAALLASYEAAEQEVRLAYTRQFPRLTLGTGIAITLPFFSRGGRPAMATAIARREKIAREFTAAVHAVRDEIADTLILWRTTVEEQRLVEERLLPNAERNLELSREAFQAGEITLLETLALQRALVEARTRSAESRTERAKQRWKLLSAIGRLTSSPTND